MSALPFRRHLGAQRGAATLVVVMVLFFIVSLVAAYTNRNLIFEQRTSANQYRSTQALEAAEAGVEWALAMLNHQRITPACTNTTSPPPVADNSYRQRYLDTDWTTGNFRPRPKSDGSALSQACVYNGSTWNCDCPVDADPAPTAPTGSDVFPAFRVRLEQIGPVPPAGAPSRPGVIRIHSVGCTRLDAACLAFDSPGVSHEGRAAVRVLAALTGNAVSPPSAAVLARGAIPSGVAVVANTDPAGSGITLHAGGAITASATLHSTPGTPSEQSKMPEDTALGLPAAASFSAEDRMFASVFNMTPSTFRQQPAAVTLECTVTCSAAEVRDAVSLHPGRPLWLTGNLLVDSGPDIGSSGAPVLLVVNGNLGFTTDVTIHGLVYARTADWSVTGSGTINGAAVAQGRLSGSGSLTVVRDADVLFTLRYGSGSFVRLPGSWKDFE